MRQAVCNAMVSDAVAGMDRLHVVVVTDPIVGVFLEGPYPNGLEAVIAAVALEAERGREGCDSPSGASIAVWPLSAPRVT